MTEQAATSLRAIRGCLSYVLMDVEEMGLERVARLMRLAITELNQQNEPSYRREEGPTRPNSLT